MSFEAKCLAMGDWISAVIKEELENPAELFSSLRSGAFLCQLMNELMSDDLEFDPFPEDVAVERQNVETFVNACSELGLEVLFEPDDLIEQQDVRKVLDTLIKLAEAAVDIGYEGPALEMPADDGGDGEPAEPEPKPVPVKAAPAKASKVAPPPAAGAAAVAKKPVAVKGVQPPPAKVAAKTTATAAAAKAPAATPGRVPAKTAAAAAAAAAAAEEPEAAASPRMRSETDALLETPWQGSADGGASEAHKLEVSRMKAQLERANASTASQTKLKDEANAKLAKEREKVKQLEAQLAEEQQAGKKRVDDKQADTKATKQQMQELQARVQELEQLNNDYMASVEEHAARIEELEVQAEAATREADDAHNKAVEWEEAYARLQQEADAEEARLRDEVKRLEDELAKAKEAAAAATTAAASSSTGKVSNVSPRMAPHSASGSGEKLSRVSSTKPLSGAAAAAVVAAPGALQKQLSAVLEGKPGSVSGNLSELFKKDENRQVLATCLKQAMKKVTARPIVVKAREFDAVLVAAAQACIQNCDAAEPGDLKVARRICKAAAVYSNGSASRLRNAIASNKFWADPRFWSSKIARRCDKLEAQGAELDGHALLFDICSEMIAWDVSENVLVEFVAVEAGTLNMSDDEALAVLDEAYAAKPEVSPQGDDDGDGGGDGGSVVETELEPSVPRKGSGSAPAGDGTDDAADGGAGGDDGDDDNGGNGEIVREGMLKFRKGTRWIKASAILRRKVLVIEYDDAGPQMERIPLSRGCEATTGCEQAPSALKSYSFKLLCDTDGSYTYLLAMKNPEVADWVAALNAVCNDEELPEAAPKTASVSPRPGGAQGQGLVKKPAVGAALPGAAKVPSGGAGAGSKAMGAAGAATKVPAVSPGLAKKSDDAARGAGKLGGGAGKDAMGDLDGDALDVSGKMGGDVGGKLPGGKLPAGKLDATGSGGDAAKKGLGLGKLASKLGAGFGNKEDVGSDLAGDVAGDAGKKGLGGLKLPGRSPGRDVKSQVLSKTAVSPADVPGNGAKRPLSSHAATSSGAAQLEGHAGQRSSSFTEKSVFPPTPGSTKEGDVKLHLNKKWLRCHLALTQTHIYLIYVDPANNEQVTLDVPVKNCKLAPQSPLAPAALRDSSWRLKDIEENEYHLNSNAKKDATAWMKAIMDTRDGRTNV